MADDRVGSALKELDANDLIYQLDASRYYNPWPRLEAITAPVTWINSADDFGNPPELGLAEKLAALMPKTKFIMLPISPDTRGHGTHSLPKIWGSYLKDFLATLKQW